MIQYEEVQQPESSSNVAQSLVDRISAETTPHSMTLHFKAYLPPGNYINTPLSDQEKSSVLGKQSMYNSNRKHIQAKCK
jgi:hypothetical protein